MNDYELEELRREIRILKSDVEFYRSMFEHQKFLTKNWKQMYLKIEKRNNGIKRYRNKQ